MNIRQSLALLVLFAFTLGISFSPVMSAVTSGLPSSSGFQTMQSTAGPLSAKRSFQFTYKTTVQVPENGNEFSVHIPLPQDSPWQEISDVTLESPLEPTIYHDSKHGNKIVRYDFDKLDGRTVTISHRFDVYRTKREQSIPSDLPANPSFNRSYYSQFLKHHTYMETNKDVKAISIKAVKNAKTYREKLRSLYDRVMGMMEYDKSGQGWGRGDIDYCIKVGEGNCTDFHTLYSSLAREQGIPARFIMGFPIPRTKSEGSIGGYHCWAETYVPGSGWFPMDISEADKHSDLEDFYFGTLDADRVNFTSGKNIPLSSGKNVNFLVYPVVDGNKNAKIKKSFSFKNL